MRKGPRRAVLKMLFRSCRDVIASLRPIPSVIALVLSVVVVVCHSGTSVAQAAVRCAPILLVTMIGFIVNDLFDREKDNAGGVRRPIASGNLSPRSAWMIAGSICLASVALEGLWGSASTLLLIIVSLVAVVCYTPAAHRAPLAKGAYTGLLCCLPLWYGSVVSSAAFPVTSYLSIFVFVLGRETLLDQRDLDADSRFGLHTWTYYLGRTLTGLLGWGAMVVGIALVWIGAGNGLSLACGIGAAATLSLSFLIYRSKERFGLKLTRLAMLLGAVSLAGNPL